MARKSHNKNIISDYQVNKELAKLLKKICKQYGYWCSITFGEPEDGECGEADAMIKCFWVYANKESTVQTVISLFFHELAHCFAYQHGKYKRYHEFGDKKITKRDIKYILKFGLRIEKGVDNIAAKLMKFHFPKLKYLYWYNNPYVVFGYREDFLGKYKKKLTKTT